MYNFFISSTSKDLIEERKAVIDCVLETHNFPVAMELFNANSFSQWEYIKKEIDNIDYYILILGGKYGTISPNEQISYTEKEFNYAREKGIPIMPFVIEDTNKLPFDKNESEEPRRKLLENFRKKVTSGLLVDFYTNKDDLKYKVSLAIHTVTKEKPRPGWIRGNAQEISINNIPTISKEDIDSMFVRDNSKNETIGYIESNIFQNSSKQTPLEILHKLSEKARQILCEVYADPDKQILVYKTLDGDNFQTNGKSLMLTNSKRESIEIEGAISELVQLGLLSDLGNSGEVFQITKKGFEVVDITPKTATKPLENNDLPNISLDDIESLTVILGDTQQGLSHAQIEKYFDICNIKNIATSAGKPDKLYQAFKNELVKSNSSGFMWHFIKKALDPIRRNNNVPQYEYLLKGTNNILKKYRVVFIDGYFYSMAN